MDGGDGAGIAVPYQYGDAVSGSNGDRPSGLLSFGFGAGNHAITLKSEEAGRRAVGKCHQRAVDLETSVQVLWIEPDGCSEATEIFGHILRAIDRPVPPSDGAVEVEGVKGGGAYSADSGREPVFEAMRGEIFGFVNIRFVNYHDMPNVMLVQDPLIGRTILNGQFEILEKIGAGGMGSVYKAAQSGMERMVAVKILHPKLVTRIDLVSRFRREARAMSQLTHPNTVKVLLYGELEDGLLYIVMEYLQGKNLNQLLRASGPMSLNRALIILIQACGALHEAHEAGIVHRDLKPENIFVCSNAEFPDFTKVLDFGLAKVTERQIRAESLVLTQEGMIFGTPEFMSPEQAEGKTLTPASDIYSLAVILYEILTGKLPFEAKNPMQYLQLHVGEPPIPLRERVANLEFPVVLEHILQRALAKRPEDRFASAAEFALAMESVLVKRDGDDVRRGSAELRPLGFPVGFSQYAPAGNRPLRLTWKYAPLAIVALVCLTLGALIAVGLMTFTYD